MQCVYEKCCVGTQYGAGNTGALVAGSAEGGEYVVSSEGGACASVRGYRGGAHRNCAAEKTRALKTSHMPVSAYLHIAVLQASARRSVASDAGPARRAL